jgi:UDP-glucose 4-epimerase
VKRNVLVTGGLGFVGARLSAELAAHPDTKVVVVDCELTGSPDNLPEETRARIDLVKSDLSDEAAAREIILDFRPEVIFHLAAIHFIPLCNSRPTLAVRMNVQSTANVLDAAASLANPPCLVFASTAAVYAPSDAALTESSSLGPTDIYGLTKLWGEQLVARYRDESEAPTAILRLFNVVGEGETNPHLIPSILVSAGDGSARGVLRLGNLTTRRDYVYVGDVAKAFAAAPDVAAEHGALLANVCTGVASSGYEVLDVIGLETAKSCTVETDPNRVRSSDRPVLLGNADSFSELFGWRPATDLRHSVRSALERPVAPSYASAT